VSAPLQVVAEFAPAGDQPQAIDGLCEGINDGLRFQTLLGVTGSGKTLTVANLIDRLQRPDIVCPPNKLLAGHLFAVFRE